VNSKGAGANFPTGPVVVAAGGDLRASVENHPDPREIDHVRVMMDAGIGVPVFVSINTLSKRNRLAGFDARIRAGIVRGGWESLPARGVREMGRFDYADIERSANVFFEHFERSPLEEFLLDRCRRALILEAWGAPYLNRGPGIHQIHSRRASCAVPEDIRGRDGGLRFYFEAEKTTETVLLKFCGQP